MHLLNPLFLLGILGVALPILIHLMGRRKAPPYRFSAIDFILRSQKRIEARFKLQNLFLLFLRAGVILLIALALAKPLLQEKGAALASMDTPSSNVFVIDNSLSMNYQIKEGPLIEKAKLWARGLIHSLSPYDEGCVLAIYPPSDQSFLPGPTSDKGQLLGSLERIEPSFCSAPLSPSLGKALLLLKGSKKELKRIFLFTDLTKNSWRETQKLVDAFKEESVLLHIIDTTTGQMLPNLAITTLESSYDWTKKDGKVHLKATIHNFSDTPTKNLLVKVVWGDKPEGMAVAQGFLNLPPHSQGVKEFFLDPPEEAIHWGYVEIIARTSEQAPTLHDGLVVDNLRYFTLPSIKDISVLVIDGSPSIHLYKCESFYLERALNPTRLIRSCIKPTVVIPQEIHSVNFKDFDMVILANVGELPPPKVAELNGYVKEGGRVLFGLGNNVRPEYYNTSLGELVPKLRMAVEFSKESGGLGLGAVDTSHPILKVFAGESSALLKAPNFFKVFLVEPQTAGSVNTILSYSNGAPALLEMSCGKGRSMLFTSTFDRDWTDLPVKSIFLPLIQQICRYLTDNLIEIGPGEVMVGQEWESTSDGLLQENISIEVLDPKGNLFKPVKKTPPSRTITVSQTDYPGIYHLRRATAPPGEQPGLWAVFAVNVDPKESDLSKIDTTQLRASLGEDRVSLGLTEPIKGAEGLIAGLRLWPAMLVSALGLLALESFVAGRTK